MKLLTMNFLHGFQAKSAKHVHIRNDLLVVGLGPTKTSNLLIISLPYSKTLKLVAETILLALIIATLPSLGSSIRELPSDNQEALPLLFHELSNEGHLKSGDRVLVITRENNGKIQDSRNFGNKNEIDFVANTDIQRQSSFQNEYFDFVFTPDMLKDIVLIDRTLKVGGIATYEYTGKYHIGKIHFPSNYKVVYLRRYESKSIITLQKTKNGDTNTNAKNMPTKRRLLSVNGGGKKQVLENLEDVLLEPPRAVRSRSYLKRTRYLPDILKDSLESYPRRVFIDVGPPEKTGSTGDLSWFAKHYPTKNKDFEIYKIDTVADVGGDDVAHAGMSDWLRRNVREEEYVVMKAEAEVVEEMAKNRSLSLVDELFLECKYQGVKGHSKRSRRAYWECLALYGRLRDEGVVVHQWWG